MNKKISIADLLEIAYQRLWIIVLLTAFVITGVYLFETRIKTPMYESTATLYVLRRDNEVDHSYTQSDFKLALDVVNDCTYVLKSTEVLRRVQSELDLSMSIGRMAQRITTKNPDNTRFLEITVQSETPEMAQRIVNCLCEEGANKIEESMGFDQVNLYSYGELPTIPCNKLGLFAYIVICCIVTMITFSFFVLRFYLDYKIKEADDIQKYLGVSLLAEIPNEESKTMRKHYAYKKYSRYQHENQQ